METGKGIGPLLQKLREKPDNPENWAALAGRLGKSPLAPPDLEALESIVALRPGDPHSQCLMGIAWARQRRLDRAIDCFQKSIAIDPRHAPAHVNLGTAMSEMKRPDEAMRCFRAAIEIDPHYGEAHHNLGLALRECGRKAESLLSLQTALQCNPAKPDILHNLGLTLTELGRPGEATPFLRQAIRLLSDKADFHNSLGLALLALGRLTEAEVCFEAAIRLEPAFAQAHNNLATSFKEQGRLAEAIAQYRFAIRLDSQNASAHWNLSLALLQAGDYAAGWDEYEWRWLRPTSPMPRIGAPLWDGLAASGKTILLHAEQGMGDTIQFVRYAALLEKQGARVIFQCPSPLVDVLSRTPGLHTIVAEGKPLPPYDVHLPLMSAPHRLGLQSAANLPSATPYVFPDPERSRRWADRINDKAGGKLSVGIAWRGNPNHQLDAFRSIDLHRFEPLSQIPNSQLFSLQRGPGSEQLDYWARRLRIVELTDRASRGPADWSDTAAIISNLDLVITVDTATAHLAGAIGVPVWILISTTADWRWLIDRNDSTWYPSARLFRQSEPGKWETVFERIEQSASRMAAAWCSSRDSSPLARGRVAGDGVAGDNKASSSAVAVATLVTSSEYEKLAEITLPSQREYAHRIHADFIVLNERGYSHPHYDKWQL
jgi:tetratricopeptide (TPR) repeat protein